MFSFHPIIQSNYGIVHEWLSRLDDLPEYRLNNAWSKADKQLKKATLESAALQYYVFFPAHSAKVAFALEHIIGAERLTEWFKYNSHITVIDVGCGAGAASIAFVNSLLNLRESGQIEHPVSLHFIGIDPNENALAIYYQQIDRLKPQVESYDISLTITPIAESDLQAVNQLREELARHRATLNVPFLTHVFLFQANVVSPFSTRYHETQTKRNRLQALGVPKESLGDVQDVFGREEAIAYKQILENSAIDNLHIITVGTEGYEQRVTELAQAIDSEFQGNNHVVERLNGGEKSVTYKIPDYCYWKDFKDNDEWDIKFCVEVSSISNVALADEDWREVNSKQNLLSAWARSRHHLLEQTLVDEVEIRLFESKLDANIAKLQQQLVAYAQDVVHTDDRLHFKFPKSSDKLRPLGLSRIEEEILSTALIQKLGQRISDITGNSYAYKFSRAFGNQATEYLYENWFNAYGKYIEDARSAAKNIAGCVVIQTDIKSFYTRIIRDSLIQLSIETLSRSTRVEWLLKVLFSRDIDGHEAGKGIVQGNIASGFFANLYLVDLDARFTNNEWDAKFFRYVDDMIVVVPNPEHVSEVISALEEQLAEVGLELNLEKTEYFLDASEFILATDKDETLDDLQNQFQHWINCLWILNDQHRQVFRRAYNESQAEWWYRIEIYGRCLKSIGIAIEVPLLSRRVYKYLFNEKLCERDSIWQEPFAVPSLPDSNDEELIGEWAVKFEEANVSWIKKSEFLLDAFQEMLVRSRTEIINALDLQDVRSEKRWTSVFRFCVNKLIQIGFDHEGIVQIVSEALATSPWLIRNPHKVLESIAVHGHARHLESLLLHYMDETDEMKQFMKSVILRAIRFLPQMPSNLWEQIRECAVSSSDVISLMATETWLVVIRNEPELALENHSQPIRLRLSRDPKPILRLMKNYLLILGEESLQLADIVENKQDTVFRDIREIVHSNNIDSLFDYYEPEVLSREFYSGYRSDNGDYYPA